MNNYCLMAGQIMSLVTHNANRCVSFMKIVGFECLELYDWMIFWPEQRACSHDCTSSWMSMQDVPTQVGWVEPSWNETWHCVEPRMVHRATLRAPRPDVCMGCKHKNSAFHHSIQNVVHGALYLWLKILIVQEAEFDSTAVGIRSNCIIFWAWKGEKGSGQMCSV